MSESDLRFCDFMKKLREDARLSLEDAALQIGVGVSLLENWEAGRGYPSELSAQSISAVYGVGQNEWLTALKAETAKIKK